MILSLSKHLCMKESQGIEIEFLINLNMPLYPYERVFCLKSQINFSIFILSDNYKLKYKLQLLLKFCVRLH